MENTKYISKVSLNGDLLNIKDAEARQTLATKANDSEVIKRSEMGVANGIATLDSGGKVPSTQLPSYVDDVIEGYYNNSKFYTTFTEGNGVDTEDTYSNEITAEAGKIYVDKPTNLTYRWSGSAYIAISSPLALGETSSTAYAGDKGKALEERISELELGSQYTPTLQSAPTTSTISYERNDTTVLFEIGQFCRVADSTSPTGYKFYQLNDLTNNGATAIWGAYSTKVPPTYVPPTAKENLVYNNTDQALLNAGSTEDGTIQYSTDGTSWSTTIPTAKTGGDHTVYWRLSGDATHADILSTAVTVTIAKVTPTYTAPQNRDLTYNGEAQDLLVAGSTNYGTMQYSSDNTNWSTSVPTATDADLYIVYYRILGNESVNDVAAQVLSTPIAQKEITPTITLTPSSYTYNGSDCEPAVEVKDGDVIVPAIEYSIEYSNNKNAGTATVTIEDTDHNYIISGSEDFTINKAAGQVTTLPVNRNVTYNGSAQPVADAGAGTGTMYYRIGDSGDFTTTMPTLTDSGIYVLYFYAAESDNYNQSQTEQIYVTVAKAAPTHTAPTSKNLSYTGESQILLNAGSTIHGTIYYSEDGENWSSNIPSGTNAGQYPTHWKLTGDANHADIPDTTIVVTISKVAPSYTAPTAKSLVYNGESQALLNAGSSNEGTVKYSEDGENWSTNITEGTDAGEYVSYWKLEGDINHTDIAADTITTTIAKVTPTVVAPTAISNLEYDGTNQVLAVAGYTDYGTMQYSLDGENYLTSVPSATNADAYTLYYKVVGDSNINNVAASSIECEIDKADPTYTAPTAKSNLEYTGSSQALLNAGVSEHGTFKYSTDNSEWSDNIPTGTNADEYTCYWKLVGDSNHNDIASTSITAEIAKADAAYTAPTAVSGLEYTGSAQELLSAGSTSDGEMQYSLDGVNFFTTIPSVTNAGDYTPQWKIVGDSNHNDVAATTINVSVAKVAPTYTAPTVKSSLVYSGSAQALLNAGETSHGTILYSTNEENWSASVPEGTNADTYTMYWKLTGDTNHNDVASSSLSTSIAKVTPTVVAPTAKVLDYRATAQELVNAGSTDFGTLQYSKDNENWSTAIPTETALGNYTVYYRVVGNSNINDVAAVSVACSISERVLTNPTIELSPSSFTYDGNACEPTVIVKDGDVTIPSSEYEVVFSNNTNAGTATVTIIDNTAGNYDVTGSTTFEIAKAAPNYTAPTAKTSLVYDNTDKSLLNAGSTDAGTIEYSTDGENWSTSVPTGKNADTYSLYWRLDGGSNFQSIAATQIDVTIAKVTPTVTAPVASSLTYNGNAQTLASAGSTNWGTLKYSLDNSNWQDSVPTSTNANSSITLYYKVVGDSNINDVAAQSVTCAISKAAPTYTAPTAKSGLTYTGSAQDLLNAGSTDHGTIQYSSNGSTWGTSIPTSTNASTSIIVYWRLVGDSNHSDVSSTSITCSIAKANISASVSMSGWTYSGTALSPSVSGNSGSGSVTYNYKVSSAADSTYTSTKPSNAGTYTVRAQIAETTNYNGATVTTNFTISRANLSASVSMSGWTYGGTAQNPSVSGNSGSGSVTYTYKVNGAADSTYTSTKPSNAGTYVVRAVIAQTTNYNSATVTNTFTISRANLSASVSMSGWTYGGSATNPSVSGNSGSGSVTYTYKVNGAADSTYTSTKPSNAGTYVVRAQIAQTTNYNSATVTNTFTISKASLNAPTASGATTTYPTTATATASGGGGQGSIEWSNGNTQTSVGSKSTLARWSGNSNYNASGWSSSVTITMNKADLAAPTATGATVNYGSTATATASGGGGQGSLQWSNGNTRTAVGSLTTSARWSGNGNYNASPYSNSVTLTVNDPYNGHAYVDLGLPSGTKWATMDVGASSATIANGNQYGNVYAYGSTTPTVSDSYPYPSSNGGSTNPLPASYDVATQNWGGSWHIPTKTQWEELFNNCTILLYSEYSHGEYIHYFSLKSNLNNNTILFHPVYYFYEDYWYPAASESEDGYNVGSYWWSSTPVGSNRAYAGIISYLNDSYMTGYNKRTYACSQTCAFPVRPVVG